MALGGGTFTTMNKPLPGAYINVVSRARATAELADRGIAALALPLSWGPDGTIFTVTAADFQKDSRRIFGYAYADEALKGLRDLFAHCQTARLYKLNQGAKAENTYAAARYTGARGNDLRIVVSVHVDDTDKFDVETLLGADRVDLQTVSTAAELSDNDFVTWKSGVTLKATAGEPLTGGTDGDVPDGGAHQAFLDLLESYSFNTLGCLSTENTVKRLYVAYTKRMRDEVGAKFQCVIHQPEAPDYEGVIGVENETADAGWPVSAVVYWMTGAQAGCTVNRDCTNQRYDGEFTVKADYRQSELEAMLAAGKLVFHRVGEDIRILEDVNTFTSFRVDKNRDFSSNQTMRVIDQIANDIAYLFHTRHLGLTPNDADGRIAFRADIVKHHQTLLDLRAIQNFVSEDVTVEAGDEKPDVVVREAVQPVNCMRRLYMTTTIV